MFLKMKNLKFTKSYVEIIVFVACLAALVVIPMLRSTNLGFPGTESYFNQRMGTDFSTYDELSYGGRNMIYMSGLPFIINILPQTFMNLLPIIFGILTLITLYFLLKKLNIKYKEIILLVYTFSPTTIYLISTLNNYFIPLFLILIGFLMYQYKKLKLFSIIPFSTIILFNINMAIITLIFLGLNALINKEKEKYIFFPIFVWYILFILLFTGAKNLFLKTTMYHDFIEIINYSISDFGAIYGLGIFAVILAIIGMIKVWEFKYQNLLFFSFFTILIFSLILINETIFLINIFISIFCAKGIVYLFEKKWVNETLKILILFVIVSGLMFSFLIQIDKLNNELPNSEIMDTIDYIKGLEKGVMFSDITRGHWISYAGMKNVMDQNIILIPDFNQRKKDSITLFQTRNIHQAKEIIEKYNISYFWMDKGIDEKYYVFDDEGFKFILKYSKDFDLIYDNNYVNIYKFEEKYI